MKFSKNLFFKEKKIELKLSNLVYKKNNLFIFGFPQIANFSKINKYNIKNEYKNISGYFFILVINKNSVEFYTDIVSNYRVYFMFDKNKLSIFDDNHLQNYSKKSILEKDYFNFFKEKNYTPGDKTFFKNIYKFQPSTHYYFDKKLQIKKKILFPNLQNRPNIKKCKTKIKKYFQNSINKIKNEKIVLLFSGGLDSYFLYKTLKENKIKFRCAYFYTHPASYETEKNLQKVKLICKNDKKILDLVKINLKDLQSTQNFIKKKMVFNYHFSLLFYKGIEYLKEKYGKNILIISGQSCDSILSFGPSQNTIPNFFARYLINYPFSLFSKLIPHILNLKFKLKLTNPKNLKEFYSSFFKSFYYYPLNYPSNFKKYSFFRDLFKDIKFINYRYSKLMFLKCYGFLQGPDNMVMIKSANYHRINKIFLPFASYEFISIILKYYNFQKDVFFPKYILKSLCKEYDKFEKRKIKFDIYLAPIDLKMKNNYIKYLKKNYEIEN